MGEGRDGDWECSGCNNRNYAFRSFCNRCKQPRLLVDAKTPADSKWLPRIGDWICTGCTNNNYASREKCKKCGQPKEIAAMPATAMSGLSIPTYSSFLNRAAGATDQRMNAGILGNGAPQQSLALSSNWPIGAVEKYGIQQVSSWPIGENHSSGVPYGNPGNNPLSVPKGWRNGDWICNCGFHNYSSRTQCKNCNASVPPVGTKRLASDEFVNDWDSKRLNLGHADGQQQPYPGYDQILATNSEPKFGLYASYANTSFNMAPNWPAPISFSQHATASALCGKGAKQWRNGDWMCSKCNNHNYASRAQCNRCKTGKDSVDQPVNAA